MFIARNPCFLIALVLFLLLVSTGHGDGAQLTNAADPAEAERTTMRIAGHGYSSHSGAAHPEQAGGGAGNLAARSHHRTSAASSRRVVAGFCSSPATCALLGALLVVVMPVLV